MTREEVLSRLRPHEAELRQSGVCGLYLFGSAARNEAASDSDIDLAFDLDDLPFSILSQSALQVRLSDVLSRNVDFVRLKALRPKVAARVRRDLVKIF